MLEELECQLKWLCLNGYFIRDDYHIRIKCPETFKNPQAWSLFQADDGQGMKRLGVFSYDYLTSIREAYQMAYQHKQEK